MHNLAPEMDVTIEDWDHPEKYGFGKLLRYHNGIEKE